MSKTIEYVNEEIKYWQKTINTLRSEKLTQKIIVTLNPLYKVENATLCDSHILAIEKKLTHLQQIKCELEAWEVVKKYCDYQDNDRFNCLKGAFYLIEPIKGLDFVTLKKALEVKENEKED